jgi:hypothetical protein
MSRWCNPGLAMNDRLNLVNSRLRGADFQAQAESWRRAHRQPSALASADLPRAVVIRASRDDDVAALRRLARLEGRWLSEPSRLLVAEVEGEIQAALPLDGGEALADPFRATAALVEILKLRASEVRGRPSRRRHRWLRSLLGQPHPA